ncbi:hypothetical protein [Roseicella aquatilis]|uniref:Uncharacterized protein n=1 Tax=Roseicella aquatilis TaxID=2527868 RepID=A0A4R4DK07_9PROT|nr:hypothetical protein [Roseicella aquatilis]TCZ61055.1 hypothetical protein EXY23_13035 [Roseicella aquatilis]
MNRHLARWAALGVVAGVLGACAQQPRPAVSAAPATATQVHREGAGGATPSVNVTGGGLGNAEFTHPGVTGTGHAH